MKLNKLEKNIINGFSSLKIDSITPFKAMSEDLNIEQDELIEKIQKLKKMGIIKKISARIDYSKFGYSKNSLVAWDIKSSKVKKIARQIDRLSFVSHAYIRKTTPDFRYNFFTMIHARSKADLFDNINDLARLFCTTDFKQLDTLKELKKSAFFYNG